MEDPTQFDLILDILVILRRLLKGSEENFAYYRTHSQNIHNIINQALSHQYSKIVSESLRLAGVFVSVLRDSTGTKIDAAFSNLV